jgi:very-short-patch-repair endonuclease
MQSDTGRYPVGRWLVDFLWPERGLIVETDSYLYHRGKAAFEDDQSRDFELRRMGYRVERLSEAQLDAEPERIARWLADELRDGTSEIARG